MAHLLPHLNPTVNEAVRQEDLYPQVRAESKGCILSPLSAVHTMTKTYAGKKYDTTLSKQQPQHPRKIHRYLRGFLTTDLLT